MALLRLRRSSRVVCLLLLLTALRVQPHLEADDVACLPAVEHHDETQHAFSAGAPSPADHCDVCHLARSLRAPRALAAVSLAHAAPSSLIHVSRRPHAHSVVVEHLPARAPPAGLL